MFYSQCGQDEYLEKTVFKGHKNGIFVDVGAHDGISINNTLYFEKNNGWTGINIEPIEKVYNNLILNRPNCININCAVSTINGEEDFLCNSGYTEMISGLKRTFDDRHFERLQRENNEHKSITNLINVKTKRLENIFEENDIKHINYLSIDVEGAEFDVIQSINFDKVFIDVIGFENNFYDNSVPIINYLKEKNFVLIFLATDIFMIHRNSNFINNIT
jgi:FkbM family methyltransferase